MALCARCGHHIKGIGRFCTNCGHPVDAPFDAQNSEELRTDTAERPAIRENIAPPAATVPPAARFPLYADEATVAPGAVAEDPYPAVTVAPHQAETAQRTKRDRSPALPWLLSAVAVIVIAGLVGALLLLGNNDGAEKDSVGDAQKVDPQTSEPRTPGEITSTQPGPAPKPGQPQDVAVAAMASAEHTAPPNEDVDGNTVRYAVGNLLDDDPSTCWRMPGDGTDDVITITLNDPTQLTEVGVINGYAKTDGAFDWYTGNRRVLAVEWAFDDGTTVQQSLTETRDLQKMKIDPITTQTVQLRLLDVTKPGGGPNGRDFTALSTVRLLGVPIA